MVAQVEAVLAANGLALQMALLLCLAVQVAVVVATTVRGVELKLNPVEQAFLVIIMLVVSTLLVVHQTTKFNYLVQIQVML